MSISKTHPQDDIDLSFQAFHDLMAKKIYEILLVSSPYEAFILQEDGRLAKRISHEYQGLNLSAPPRLTWVSTSQEALCALSRKKFDLAIKSLSSGDMDPFVFGREVKARFPELPVILLTQSTDHFLFEREYPDRGSIDAIFVWHGDSDLFLAIIMSVEDRMNIINDTQRAWVRVIIVVEDSPFFTSSLLPVLYKEIILQTQATMEESINEEHRLRRMRARPKILVAENFEDAADLYRKYAPYLLTVLSDIRFPKDGKLDEHAGLKLLSMIKKEHSEMPLLVFSSEESNRDRAIKIPAVFLDKNSSSLHADIRSFFLHHLGFGDFIFQLPDGKVMTHASSIRAMEKILPTIPNESIDYHAKRNDFSNWLMARGEIFLASKLRGVKALDFSSAQEIKDYLISNIRQRRKKRQAGIVSNFVAEDFDPETDFLKIGKGSLGGKARGLAFLSALMEQDSGFHEKFPDVIIRIPKTLVISTDDFDSFITHNKLRNFLCTDYEDDQLTRIFLDADLPDRLLRDLQVFLAHVNYPLAVRSSSLLEDARYQPCAGIYDTFMIPNNHPDLSVRHAQLVNVIKLIYASMYMETPRSFARSTSFRIEEEKMAVIVQQMAGGSVGDYFYPDVSGIVQSYNFYPVSPMKSEDGVAHIGLGLGKIVLEGGTALRFSPRYPQFLLQFSMVDDILKNSQRFFYALKMTNFPAKVISRRDLALEKLSIYDAADHPPVKFLSSTYFPEDHRIRDTAGGQGHPVLTFASILKYKLFPLPEILSAILKTGERGMGSPIEIEFAVNFPFQNDQKPEFSVLQIRSMPMVRHPMEIEITESEINRAFCFSSRAMGNGILRDISDIVFIKPDTFDPAHTVEIADEIRGINRGIFSKNHKYLLIGPGRWGSADRWLGVPVQWKDISGVRVIIETKAENLQVEPSQGSHFFHNITSLGISYITISGDKRDFLDWNWLRSLPSDTETEHLKHVRLKSPITIKIDGKKSCAVLLKYCRQV